MGPLRHHTHCQYHLEEGILGKSDPSLTHPLDGTVIWDSSKKQQWVEKVYTPQIGT